MSWRFPPMFSSSLIISGLTLRSSMHLEFIFVYGEDKGPASFFCVNISIFPSTKAFGIFVDEGAGYCVWDLASGVWWKGRLEMQAGPGSVKILIGHVKSLGSILKASGRHWRVTYRDLGCWMIIVFLKESNTELSHDWTIPLGMYSRSLTSHIHTNVYVIVHSNTTVAKWVNNSNVHLRWTDTPHIVYSSNEIFIIQPGSKMSYCYMFQHGGTLTTLC